jgi:hypothetical protein
LNGSNVFRPQTVMILTVLFFLLAGLATLPSVSDAQSPIEVAVLRSGRQMTVNVRLGPAPGSTAASSPPPLRSGSAALPQPPNPSAQTRFSGSAQGIRLQPYVVRDPQINNLEALRFLIPADWRVTGGILWRHDRAILATAVLRVSNPKGSEEFNFLPLEQFAQSNPGWGFGIGSNYLGSELQPAMDPQTFVSRIVFPRYRREIAGATLVTGSEVPAVAQAAQTPGMGSQVRAGRFRFSYNTAGRAMEEDVYCVLNYTAVPAAQTTYWSPLQLYSMRAEKGQLDDRRKLMQVIASSVRVNLRWFNAYLQVWEMWKANVMQSIQNAGHLSRYVAGIQQRDYCHEQAGMGTATGIARSDQSALQ